MIVGIDEVGRGAWAGPLVVGAVALGDIVIEGLTDSKLLSKKKRLHFSDIIKEQAPLVGIGWVSAIDIDNIGLSAALKLAASRAVAQIDMTLVEQIIIDGTIKLLDDSRATTMKKADLLVPSVSAASVIAKVARDRYMSMCDDVFEGYEFSRHVGYGSSLHQTAIATHGVLPIHRKSFAPIALALGNQPRSKEKQNILTVGHRAETAACEYLETHGYTIIDRNWRTKWCEIDIIAEKDSVISFVEVKYRSSDSQGGGVAAITPSKVRQMRFAAELWLRNHPHVDAQLAAVEVAGTELQVRLFIESL
ncbi:MAG: ribonuclease HII [Candidatus Saccharimonadales bacterium]